MRIEKHQILPLSGSQGSIVKSVVWVRREGRSEVVLLRQGLLVFARREFLFPGVLRVREIRGVKGLIRGYFDRLLVGFWIIALIECFEGRFESGLRFPFIIFVVGV